MASNVIKPLYESAALPSSVATQYTCPDRVRALLKQFTICNSDSATNYGVTVHLVESGGSATAANKIVDNQTIPAGASVTLPTLINHALNPGDTIQCFASTAAVLNLRISGVEIAVNPA